MRGEKRQGYGDSSRVIRLYLGRNPNKTIPDIEAATGIPYATIHEELTHYRDGQHEEPRYTTDGYERSDAGGRPGLVWRLVTEPKAAARKRLKAAFHKIGGVVAEHPELISDVVTWAMSLAATADRRKKGK